MINRGSPVQKAYSALAIILVALTLGACRQWHKDDPRTQPPLVEVTTVQPVGSADVAFTGIVEARVQSNLGFRVAGKVIQRLVNTGDEVRRGQLLMRIDPTDLALAVAAKNAAVASARAELCLKLIQIVATIEVIERMSPDGIQRNACMKLRWA